MDELRPEIQEAFAKEQSKLGNVADSRERLVRGALAARNVHREGRTQLAAGVAAVVIAALVIATFAYVRNGIGPARHAPPVPASSPTPLSRPLNVPSDTPVILYHDPVDFDQLDGTTWDGKIDGRVGHGITNGGVGNAQGSLYTTMGDIRDRTGQVVATYDPKNQGVFWADDGVHFCDVVRTGSRNVRGPGMLQTGAVGQAETNVTQIGMFAPANLQGGGPVVAACSPPGDRAVVYQAPAGGVGVVQIWVIQLSTGRELWTGGGGGWIAASHDGRYVALADGSGQTTIYGAGGAALAKLDGTVFAFSWDGTLAVAAGNFGAAPSTVNWSNGQTIWTCPDNKLKYWDSFAEPGGSHLAIGVLDPAFPQTRGFAPVDLFVVGADGIVAFERKNVTLFMY